MTGWSKACGTDGEHNDVTGLVGGERGKIGVTGRIQCLAYTVATMSWNSLRDEAWNTHSSNKGHDN